MLHVRGRDAKEVEDGVRAGDGEGLPARPRPGRHPRPGDLRRRAGGERAAGAGARAGRPTREADLGARPATCATVPKLFEHLRTTLGDDVELLHDVHERISPSQAVQLCKELEKYRLFFLEDPLPPEEKDHFRLICGSSRACRSRWASCSTRSKNTCR